MRFLIVGVGGIGGYFGGRLLGAGRDVTFLVRPGRAARLAESGLSIRSPFGDAHHDRVPTVQADGLAGAGPFDVILLACKAYHLDEAIADVAPAVGPGTLVLPLLNGMKHLDVLDARFGPERVLGGLCLISSHLDGEGRIVHVSDVHRLTLGARSAAQAGRAAEVARTLDGAGFEVEPSPDVILAMWEKWVFLATLAGITCLTRASVGDVARAGADDLTLALLEECRSIAEAAGRAPREAFLKMSRGRLVDPSSSLVASMLLDVERGGPTEADHVLGDLLARRPAGAPAGPSILRAAYGAVQSHQLRVLRERPTP